MKTLKIIFSYQPREALYRAVLTRIDTEKIKKAKRGFVIFVASSLFSFGMSLFALKYVMSEFAKSEFPQYFSLLFSDGGTVFFYWKEFSVLLTESLPLLGLSLFLTTILITLFFLRGLLRNFSKISYVVTH